MIYWYHFMLAYDLYTTLKAMRRAKLEFCLFSDDFSQSIWADLVAFATPLVSASY